jgi:TatD DNase family protein
MGDFDEDREAMIRRALDAGVGLIAIGTTLTDSLAGIRLAEKFPHEPVYATIGVHPEDEDLGDVNPFDLQVLINNKVVAVGETGLDYHHAKEVSERDLQIDLFEQEILLSQATKLPLIVHCRDVAGSVEAYDHVATLLRRYKAKNFVMHCFSGSWKEAEMFLELGGMLSFTGIVTFPKSEDIQEVVKKIPADRLMVETDAPFLAPVPERGKRNEPSFVKYVAEKVAELRGVSYEEMARVTTENAVRFFRLPAGTS